MTLIKEDNQISDEESEDENEEVITKKPKSLTTDDKKILTDCGNEIIIKKSRSTKKQNIQKPIVLYLEDLMEEDCIPKQKVIVKTKKGKGRPKKKQNQ